MLRLTHRSASLAVRSIQIQNGAATLSSVATSQSRPRILHSLEHQQSNLFLLPSQTLHNPSACQLLSVAHFSSQPEPPKRPSFFGNIISNIKSEYGKSKEMQESLKKFREEAENLEKSDAIQEARRKFKNIESETSKGVKDQLSGFTDKLKESLGKSEIPKCILFQKIIFKFNFRRSRQA